MIYSAGGIKQQVMARGMRVAYLKRKHRSNGQLINQSYY